MLLNTKIAPIFLNIKYFILPPFRHLFLSRLTSLVNEIVLGHFVAGGGERERDLRTMISRDNAIFWIFIQICLIFFYLSDILFQIKSNVIKKKQYRKEERKKKERLEKKERKKERKKE